MSIGYGTRAVSIDQTITEAQAKEKLVEYLYSVTYKKLEKYNLTESQKIALSSFDYNTNKVDKLFVEGKLDCKRLLKYVNVCKDGVCTPVAGLQKRRLEEYNLCIR